MGISRGNVYYLARATTEADQRLMKRIDALNLAHPFMGSRMLRDVLNREGFEVGRRHVATLMQRMEIEALYRKPNTSKKHPGHSKPLTPTRYCTRIVPHATDINTAYVTFGGFVADNVWVTLDGGATWKALGSALPAAPVRTLGERQAACPVKRHSGWPVGRG